MPDRGDGACSYLDKDSKTCTIYEDRPLLCRVDDTFDRIKKYKPFMKKEEWNIYNTKSCHELIDNLGYDAKYKINIEQYKLQNTDD